MATAALIRWQLGSLVGDTVPLTLFYPTIAAVTWLAGAGPALATIALGAVVGSAFFTNPPVWGSPEWLGESVRLALFVFVGVLLALLVEAARLQGRRAASSARAARDAERKWRSLVESTSDTISIAGSDGAILFANRAAGAAAPAQAAASLLDHAAPEQQAEVRAALETVFVRGEPAHYEVEARRADGTTAWYETRLVPLHGDGSAVEGALVVSTDVSDRRRSDQALRESASQFRALYESTLEATVVLDDEGRLVEVNPAAAALFGLPSGQLLGSGLWEFTQSRPGFDAAWARFLADGEMRGEWRLHGPEGARGEVEFSARARVLPGRHLAVMRDISERRRAERARELLGRATLRLAASLDERETARAIASVLVPDLADWCAVDLVDELGQLGRTALAAVDPRGEELAWSLTRAAPPDGLGGASVRDVLGGGEPSVLELDGDARARLAVDAEHRRLLDASGLRAVMAVPLASRGRSLGVLWLAANDPRRPVWGAHEPGLAGELAERAGVALENARLYREAQQANRVKDEFLATLSHELRTPLNAIVGWTHLLRTAELDPPTSARALETIERNARLQSQLIADILDVSRIVSGKLRVETVPVDLAQVVTAAVDAVRPAADAKGVRLACQLDAPALTVLGDAGRLQQVAQNLLQNAVKFTGKGGDVHAGLRRSGNSAELVVQDTGVGIATEFLPHVFERFRQGDSSTTRPHGGLGLGLAITRHLVEAHGGSVEAASRGTGQGASFTVRLPALGKQPGQAPREADGAESPLAGVRVLVVDDHTDGVNVLGTILERAGASVARAGTSREAFTAMSDFRPHVLVSDLGLPEEDGFALMARVRALPTEQGGGIPAVAVMGRAQAEETARALRAGYQRHLAKPIDPLELATVVAQLARERAAARALTD